MSTSLAAARYFYTHHTGPGVLHAAEGLSCQRGTWGSKRVAVTPGFDVYAHTVRNWLHREAYRLCSDWHEAEDLVQLTLHKVHRRWEHLDGRDVLGGYTHRTLLRTYLNERRRPRWRYEICLADVPDRPTSLPGDQMNETHTALMTAVRQLGSRQRAVIALRFWQDLSVEQTATALGCTPGTVTSQTHRALARLRVTLANTASPAPPIP